MSYKVEYMGKLIRNNEISKNMEKGWFIGLKLSVKKQRISIKF